MDKAHYPTDQTEMLKLLRVAIAGALRARATRTPVPDVFRQMVVELATYSLADEPLEPLEAPIDPDYLGPIAMCFYEMGWAAREILVRQKEEMSGPSQN